MDKTRQLLHPVGLRQASYAKVFSKPLLSLVEYQLDGHGMMTVLNDTRDCYRYVDCTFIAETLFGFVEEIADLEAAVAEAFALKA